MGPGQKSIYPISLGVKGLERGSAGTTGGKKNGGKGTLVRKITIKRRRLQGQGIENFPRDTAHKKRGQWILGEVTSES